MYLTYKWCVNINKLNPVGHNIALHCLKYRVYTINVNTHILIFLELCALMIFVVFTGGRLYILDLAAKIDQCAEYLCKSQWGDMEFPPPFGRDALPEVSEAH